MQQARIAAIDSMARGLFSADVSDYDEVVRFVAGAINFGHAASYCHQRTITMRPVNDIDDTG